MGQNYVLCIHMREIQTSPSALMHSPICHTHSGSWRNILRNYYHKSGFILVLFVNVAHFWRQGTWLVGDLD